MLYSSSVRWSVRKDVFFCARNKRNLKRRKDNVNFGRAWAGKGCRKCFDLSCRLLHTISDLALRSASKEHCLCVIDEDLNTFLRDWWRLSVSESISTSQRIWWARIHCTRIDYLIVESKLHRFVARFSKICCQITTNWKLFCMCDGSGGGNEYLIAIICVDSAENRFSKVLNLTNRVRQGDE